MGVGGGGGRLGDGPRPVILEIRRPRVNSRRMIYISEAERGHTVCS